MRRKEALQGVRMAMFLNLLHRRARMAEADDSRMLAILR